MKFPLGIQRISKRSTTTVAAAFQDVLCLSTDNLFGKVGRVVFCIASRTDSRMIPSGPSEMISVADMSLTPFFFSWVLYRALS